MARSRRGLQRRHARQSERRVLDEFCHCARHLIERKGTGRIINISSGAGKRGNTKRAAYSSSKFAVIGLTQVMASELGPHGVTVNAICPGAVNTARADARTPTPLAGSPGKIADPKRPMGRIGDAEDIARVVTFLADPAADAITGESIRGQWRLLPWIERNQSFVSDSFAPHYR